MMPWVRALSVHIFLFEVELAVQNDLRQINRRRVLLAALRLGPTSRAELARDVGLSAPTAGKIVDELLAGHVLVEEPVAPAAPTLVGRPRQIVRLNSRNGRALAIQAGTVHTRLAPLRVEPPTTDAWPVELPTPASASAWQRAIETGAESLSLHKPDVVMVSVSGIVDETTGQVFFCPNMHWADGVNLASLVNRVWPRAKVHVVQDIHGLALGLLGTTAGATSFLLVDFGHGVGSTAVVDGTIHRGNLPMIGEIGHVPVVGNDRRCGCGNVGCLETLVSRQAITEAVLGTSIRKPNVSTQWASVVENITKRGLNEPLRQAIDRAGAGIAAALNALGLDRVVVTGSVAELPPVVLERLGAVVRRDALWARFGTVHIEARPRRRLAGLSYAMIDRVIAPVT